jgi:hypothetical protein
VPLTLFWGSEYAAAALAFVAAAAEVAVAAAEAAAVRAEAAAVLAAAAAERDRPPTRLTALLLKPWKEVGVVRRGGGTADTSKRVCTYIRQTKGVCAGRAGIRRSCRSPSGIIGRYTQAAIST